MFRVDRIDDGVELAGPPSGFQRPPASLPGGPPPPWRLGDEPEVVADLLVDATQAHWAVEALGGDAIRERRDDGAVRLAVAVTNRAAFRSFLLGFLDHAEILGPAELRGDMVGWLPRPDRGRRMSRPDAQSRLGRLLAIVPWVASHDGPLIAEVCRRFSVSERELLADLSLLFLCGVHPFTPDTLIEVDVNDGRVWIRFADWFRRPLRLTAPEGLALVSAGAALQATPGADPDGALSRALVKVSTVLGVGADDALDVELGPVAAPVLDVVQRAAAERRQVEIDYYSFGRDGRSVRVVHPWRVFNAQGQWYLSAWCTSAVAERLFRVDRINEARVLEERFVAPPAGEMAPAVYTPDPDDPVVVLDLEPPAHWVADQYPNEGVDDRGGGVLRVRLRTSHRAWLERLLLRAGPHARVVEGDTAVLPRAAARLLTRYQTSPDES